jgi:small-conductance mechanosensitive channel
MSLIQLVLVLIVIGVLLWAINRYIPMDATIKKILNVVVVLVAVLFVLGAFGVLDTMSGIRLRLGR